MWSRVIVIVLVALIIATAAAVLYGSVRWRASTGQLLAEMRAARLRTGVETYDPGEIADLPGPVQQYLRAVLEDGQPLVTDVTVHHIGTFNMGEGAERWRPFISTQRVVTQRPGFVWDASISMAPGLTVFVHDAYVAGRGVLIARLLGLVTVMEQPSTSELAQGELMRFLAETPWYPTALLPGQGVRWEPVDDTRARATLTDGATTVELVFEFDSQGLISSVRSNGRYRDVDGAPVATPWQGRFWDYQLRDGMLVPMEGEVEWLLPEGPQPYWRARIERIEYQYAQE